MRAEVLALEECRAPEGVQGLRSKVYAHYPEAHEAQWHASVYDWIQTHPLAEHMHRWVAVSGDEVVGHLAAIPQYYRIGGERVVAHTPADFMSLPGHAFAALALMKRFHQTVSNHVACDMVPAVITLETRMGAEVAGQLDYAAKLLDVSRLPLPPLPLPLERRLGLQNGAEGARGYESSEQAEQGSAAPPSRPRLPLPATIGRAINSALASADDGLAYASAGGAKVVELGGFDESFDDFFKEVSAAVACMPEKDAAFLRWRYGPGSPQHPVTILAVRESGRLAGYAVLRVTGETVNGFHDAFIMDLTVLPDRRDVARALLAAAVRSFRSRGVPIIRYRFSSSRTSPTKSDLARLGFFQRSGRSNSLLVGFEDQRLQRLARDVDNWSYDLGDGEATFWVT